MYLNYNSFSSLDHESSTPSSIPRPKSAMTVSELAGKAQTMFPFCIAPPPSPSLTPCAEPAAPSTWPTAPQSPPRLAAPAEEVTTAPSALKRAISCDSLCSDSSVALGDLEEANVTGYLCVGLEYDRCDTDC